MKTLSLWIFTVALLQSSFIKAQSISDLDMHNGFNKINFSLSLHELKEVTQLKKITSDKKTKEETYLVKHPDDFKVYGYVPQYVCLYFYKDQLYEIEIKLQDMLASERSTIRADMITRVVQSYGSYTAQDTSAQTKSSRKETYRYWNGQVVTLVQGWPWSNEIVGYSKNLMQQPIVRGDKWYFLNNKVVMERKNELGLNQGL
ncbi:hypothetical protein [Mucilaginibacter sp.]